MTDLPNQITALLDSLNHEQLIKLNHLVVNTIKQRRDNELLQKTSNFKLRDTISFQDPMNNCSFGVIVRINQKTLSVVTLDNIKYNVPSTHLRHVDNPSKELIKLRGKLFPTPKEIVKALKRISLLTT